MKKTLKVWVLVLPENVGTKFSTLGSYLKNIETNRGNKPTGKTKKKANSKGSITTCLISLNVFPKEEHQH